MPAATSATVLLRGESGAGKGVMARLLHAHSIRASGPFVPLHCPSLSLELPESELFGHVRGAFTGAANPRGGLFVGADRGHGLEPLFARPLAERMAWLRARPAGADEIGILGEIALGEVVRRRVVVAAAWPNGGMVSENTVDSYIRRIRVKLRQVGSPLSLTTVRGVGYTLR